VNRDTSALGTLLLPLVLAGCSKLPPPKDHSSPSKARRLIDGAAASRNGTPLIIIRNGHIEAVARNERNPHSRKRRKRVNLVGKTVIPG